MGRTSRPTEPHIFIADENGISCGMPNCGLPAENARHTGQACIRCGCLTSDHGANIRRRRWCNNCHIHCPA